MASPAGEDNVTAAQNVVIDVNNQSYELPDGSKTSHFVKDGEPTRFIFEDVKTVYQGFLRGKRVSGDGNCLGMRPSAQAPFQWTSFSKVEERLVSFGAGLSAIGVQSGQSSFIGVYGPNCPEWFVADLSNSAYSRITVALYDTLGKEAMTFILNQAEISCVVCNSVKISKLLESKKDCPQLTIIVSFDGATDEQKAAASEAGVQLYTFDEIEVKGKENPTDLVPPKPEDLVTICYTSGTTGVPKGVMLTHENLISNASATLQQILYTGAKLGPDDVHISYLPLAHMMERMVSMTLMSVGMQVGIFRGDIKTLVDDIQELKPTVFVSVPRLLNRMHDKVIAAVQGSKLKKWLFNKAYQSKLAEVRRGIVRRDSIWDKIVFKKIQNLIGGRVKMIVSGSAPISGTVKQFVQVVFGCQIYEGYGQTEGTAGITFSFPFDFDVGHVGTVIPCCRIKLKDVPEMNYYASNGEGEVCYKGANVTQGYFKNPEKTAELFDEDGWARSGDVGKWLPNGTLQIVDRVKHIFKLSQGEYIAPEKVENVCLRSVYIAQMFLHGDSLKDACVAVVVPDEEVLMGWAKGNGRGSATFEDLCKDETVREMIFQDMKTVASREGLNSLETPRVICLCQEMFSVENDLLTPTFKLKRPQAKIRYKDQMEAMYGKMEPRPSIAAQSS